MPQNELFYQTMKKMKKYLKIFKLQKGGKNEI